MINPDSGRLHTITSLLEQNTTLTCINITNTRPYNEFSDYDDIYEEDYD